MSLVRDLFDVANLMSLIMERLYSGDPDAWEEVRILGDRLVEISKTRSDYKFRAHLEIEDADEEIILEVTSDVGGEVEKLNSVL